MKAIKKINNNVAICIDNNDNELIAFGKGLGFPKMPYTITDLSSIQMTFYRIDSYLYQMIEEIPEEILEVSAEIVANAQKELKCSLNPNLVVSLSDHINFAIVRQKKYKEVKMAFSYDIENLYPEETKLGRKALELIRKKLGIVLPESEITNIAIHFINAEEENNSIIGDVDTEKTIEEVALIIENYFTIDIDRKSFAYNRFATHLRYYLSRIQSDEQFINGVENIMAHTIKENKAVYECAQLVGNYISDVIGSDYTEDELFYLMIHINRMIIKSDD